MSHREMKMRTISCILILSILSILSMSCAKQNKYNFENGEIFAYYDETPIYRTEIEQYIDIQKMFIQGQGIQDFLESMTDDARASIVLEYHCQVLQTNRRL